MPLQKLQFRPGVNRESTTTANEGGWYVCEKVRFRSGFPEKIGGWEADTAGPISGTVRSLWNWVTLAGSNLLSLCTQARVLIQSSAGGVFNDITPLRATTAAGDVTFARSAVGSPVILVNDVSHGAQTGDWVYFSGAASLGGNVTADILNQSAGYQITYISANQYSITVSVNADSSDSGTGGSSTVGKYAITSGGEIYTVGTGWGAGSFGGIITGTATTTLNGGINDSATTITLTSASSFSTSGSILIGSEIITYSGKSTNDLTGCVRGASGTTAASHSNGAAVVQSTTFTGWGSPSTSGVGIGIQLRTWSQANYGQDLIFNPRGGALYYWAVNTSPTVFDRATVMSGSDTPTVCNYVTVSDAQRFVIALGCNDYGSSTLDPMLIRWSAQEDYTNWTPAATNQAGSYRLSHGSKIISQLQTRQEILVWTDSSVYSMQYLGPPYVWGFNILADNISIVGPNGAATANNVVYWMGVDKFYMYTGRVETLPCSLRQYVFDDINLDQSFQFFASTNEGYNEIWFFYCSANSTVVDRYVVYNHLERTWYYGTMSRSAWLDSPLRQYPIGIYYAEGPETSAIMYHEAGNDNGETNPPSAITAYVESADFDIGDGHNFGFVWRIIPDVTFTGSTQSSSSGTQPSLNFTVLPRQNPGAAYGTSDNPAVTRTVGSTANVEQFTQYAYVRLRGRQMAFRVESNTLGTAWQLGTPRIDVRPDGRR